MRKGSVTIFLSLITPLIIVLLFTLVESARVQGIRAIAAMGSDAALDSVFAAYNRDLFDAYGVLFLDGGYGRGMIDYETIESEYTDLLWENLANGNVYSGGSFFPTDIENAAITSIVTATDYRGEIFMRNVLDGYKYEAVGDLVESLKEGAERIFEGDQTREDAHDRKDFLEDTDWGKPMASNSMKILPMVSQTGEEPQEEESAIDDLELKEQLYDSPIGTAQSVEAGGWLKLVLGSQTISGGKLEAHDLPSESALDERSLESDGFLEDQAKKALFNEYILDTFSHYNGGKNKSELSYEVEYILFGHKTDEENLTSLLHRILLLREGINLGFLLLSSKRAEAEAAAAALVGWTANPLIVELTTVALLAAWAYGEAILDTRSLMNGKRVSLAKTEENWRLGFSGLQTLLCGGAFEEPEDSGGLTYTDYLRLVLFTSDCEETAYRCMDLMQSHMQKKFPSFLMAAQIYALEIKTDYAARELFTLIPLVRQKRKYLYGYDWSVYNVKVY